MNNEKLRKEIKALQHKLDEFSGGSCLMCGLSPDKLLALVTKSNEEYLDGLVPWRMTSLLAHGFSPAEIYELTHDWVSIFEKYKLSQRSSERKV